MTTVETLCPANESVAVPTAAVAVVKGQLEDWNWMGRRVLRRCPHSDLDHFIFASLEDPRKNKTGARSTPSRHQLKMTEAMASRPSTEIIAAIQPASERSFIHGCSCFIRFISLMC